MGRKPKAATLEAIAHMHENSKTHANSATLYAKKKSMKAKSTTVRQSGRLRNLLRPAQTKEIELVTEQIHIVDSERDSDEGDEPWVEEVSEPEPIPSEKSLGEKVEDLIKTVEILKSEVAKRHFSAESTSDLNYKSLYFSSQKKIEALTEENHQLSKKFEIALGKLEVYENVKEMLEKWKDGSMIILTKATEAVVNLTSQARFGGIYSPSAVVEPNDVVPCSPAKRKKYGKGGSKKN